MATFIITAIDGTTATVSGWDEQDALNELTENFPDIAETRAATVRETLQAADIDATTHHVVRIAQVTMSGATTYPYTEVRDVLVFGSAKINDLQGDDPMYVGNYRALDAMAGWAELRAASPYWDADYYTLELDEPAPAELIDVINGLADYPCLDDELMSFAEQELATEHWESYGRSDAFTELSRQTGIDELDLRDSDALAELLESITFGGYELDCYPEYIDVSAFNFSAAYVASNAIRLVNAWLAAEQSN